MFLTYNDKNNLAVRTVIKTLLSAEVRFQADTFKTEVIIMLKMLQGLENKVDSFRQTYTCKSELSIDNKDTVLYLITAKAYNHDAQWLTLRKVVPNDPKARIDYNNKAVLLKWIQKEIEDYLNGNIDCESDFDKWHQSICQEIVDRINNEVLFGYKPVKIGKAQKVINMSLKLLSSLDGAERYESKFAFCHVPLDSKILNWYYSNIAKDVKKSHYKIWSNLEYEDYIKIQKDFRIYCANTEYVPLALEWKIF